MAELVAQGVPGDFGQGAGQLHPGRPAADHGEAQPCRLARRVGLGLGALEGQEQLAAQRDGIVQCLQAGSIGGPLVVAEVSMCGPGAQQQGVVTNLAAIGQGDLPGLLVDCGHLAQPHFHVALVAEDVAQWRGDIRCGQAGGGDLVQQRLEQVMVATVHQSDADAAVGQGPGGPQAGKAAADDDQVGQGVAGHALAPWLGPALRSPWKRCRRDRWSHATRTLHVHGRYWIQQPSRLPAAPMFH